MNDNIAGKLRRIGYGLPVWLQMGARIPFLFLFVFEALLNRYSRRKITYNDPCASVSVIVPARNEEKNIVSCIRSVSGSPYIHEIIVVDAGSTDQTMMKSRQAGADVLVHDRDIENGGGRGGQIKAGINAARGDVVVIIHADTTVSAVDIDRIIAVLRGNPSAIGGAVGCRFDSPLRRYRYLELANDFRAAFFKISFGDQVQFFRRRPVTGNDLFPAIPLMEDVEFSIRLHRLGRRTYLYGGVPASTRRWEHVGFRNSALVIRLVLKYLICRVWKIPDTTDYYRKYYGFN